MNDVTDHPSGLYAIRLLLPAPGGPGAQVAGRVEHVLSGRCHDFADGTALLAFLRFELQSEQRSGQQPAPVAVGRQRVD